MKELIESNNAPRHRPLGTAQLAQINDIRLRNFEPGKFWIGRAADAAETPIGYNDDRHICLVAGSRGGKGTSTIVSNLCLWPGSIVVVDPKGENASVAAARRSAGSEYCDGLEQRTYVLDPFKAATVSDDLRATFNPLDALNPNDEESADEAGRLADAIVVSQNKTEPFWDEQARTLIKALILHVLTHDDFEGSRNLVAVRHLVTSGDIKTRKILEDMGEQDIPSPFALLFEGMRRNSAFSGIVSGAGETFGSLFSNSSKTFSGVISAAGNHTEFIDSLPMQRLLGSTTPGLKLSRLKTDPMGISLFLTLPQRVMSTHFRWLRMMVTLVITEMEKTPGQPASGQAVMLCLDEFASLKKMDVIENAAAQLAGFGVKLFYAVQSLAQLKSVYADAWEVFLANAGLKIFYSVEDGFTRDYVSKFIGDTEVLRDTQNQSFTEGSSSSRSESNSVSTSTSSSSTSGTSNSFGLNGGSTAKDAGSLWGSAKSGSSGWSSSITSQNSTTSGSSTSFTRGSSVTTGESESRTSGLSQTVHKRALLTPDEIGILFGRIDEKDHQAYPGLALALIPGSQPIVVRRSNYFEDRYFVRKFDRHPDHGFKALPPLVPVRALPPPPPSVHDRLAAKYGSAHTDKAYEIIGSLSLEYPHLAVLAEGSDRLTANLMECCQKSIEIAAADGRAHTFTETLDVAAQTLGKFLAVSNPKSNAGITFKYGDEQFGLMGQQASKQQADALMTVKVIFFGVLAVIALFFIFVRR